MDRKNHMKHPQCKKAALDLMEAEWKSEFGLRGVALLLYNSTYSSWLHHFTSIMTNIVQNIEVTLFKL